MTFIFRPPTYSQGPRVTRDSSPVQRLMFRHVVSVGEPVTVLIKNGVVTEYKRPFSNDINAADKVCWGGCENVVTAAEKTLLEAAGYTVVTVP